MTPKQKTMLVVLGILLYGLTTMVLLTHSFISDIVGKPDSGAGALGGVMFILPCVVGFGVAFKEAGKK